MINYTNELERKIAEHFQDLRETATCIKARCPAHDDKKQSLCINAGDNGGVVLYCQAGCATEDVLAAVGLKMADLFPQKPEPIRHDILYDYHDEHGNLLYQVLRTPDKNFFQVRTNPEDGLRVWGLTEGDYVKVKVGRDYAWRKPKKNDPANCPRKHFLECPKVLYHLPEVIEAIRSGKKVFVVEGEKDVDNLRKLGITATTSPGGAGNQKSSKKWRVEYNDYFQGADVVIIPDNDKPGREHAEYVASGLSSVANVVKVINLPNLPDKGDVSDWIAQGGTAEKLLEIVEDTTKYIKAKGGQALTDYGNAERLIERHGSNIKYIHAWKTWLVWDGQRWRPDETEEIQRLAKETIRSIKQEAEQCDDDKRRRIIAKFARDNEAIGRIKACVSLAQSEMEVSATPKDLDKNNWKFNVQNGTLNLRTGKLEPFKKSELITKLSSVTYDPDAQCPKWLSFLDRIFDGNQELIDFIQRVSGYILTGDISEQCMFILYGTGKNGKSKFVEVLQNILGEDYWKETLTSSLMHKRQSSTNTNDIAMLAGKRFVTAVETEEGARINEPLIKQITGGDPVTARFLHQEFFTFKPTFKLFMITNHRPTIRGADEGVWRRIRMIPFGVTISEEERDRNLGEKLRTEYSGIFNWMLQGCLAWQKQGLEEPEIVRVATQNYKEEMDVIGDFIDERCLPGAGRRCTHSSLYEEYVAYCKANNEYILTSKAFAQRIADRGYVRTRKKDSRWWEGIGIKANTPFLDAKLAKGNVTPSRVIDYDVLG